MSLITTKGAKASLFAAALTLLPAAANAADALTLKADDYVGISFWLISMALVAATAFFFIETTRVQGKWKTSRLAHSQLSALKFILDLKIQQGYYP